MKDLEKLLPSSDEVDKCVFWLHFERQQGHLEDTERERERRERKVRVKKKRQALVEREQRQRWLMANSICLLLWNGAAAESCPWKMWQLLKMKITPTGLTVPELMYFFFLPFFLGFKTFGHKTRNKKQEISLSRIVKSFCTLTVPVRDDNVITVQGSTDINLHIQEDRVKEIICDSVSIYLLKELLSKTTTTTTTSLFYLVDIELTLASGQFSVAGSELPDKVMTGRKTGIDKVSTSALTW